MLGQRGALLVLRARNLLQQLGTRLLDLLALAYGEGFGAVQDVLGLRNLGDAPVGAVGRGAA